MQNTIKVTFGFFILFFSTLALGAGSDDSVVLPAGEDAVFKFTAPLTPTKAPARPKAVGQLKTTPDRMNAARLRFEGLSVESPGQALPGSASSREGSLNSDLAKNGKSRRVRDVDGFDFDIPPLNLDPRTLSFHHDKNHNENHEPQLDSPGTPKLASPAQKTVKKKKKKKDAKRKIRRERRAQRLALRASPGDSRALAKAQETFSKPRKTKAPRSDSSRAGIQGSLTTYDEDQVASLAVAASPAAAQTGAAPSTPTKADRHKESREKRRRANSEDDHNASAASPRSPISSPLRGFLQAVLSWDLVLPPIPSSVAYPNSAPKEDSPRQDPRTPFRALTAAQAAQKELDREVSRKNAMELLRERNEFFGLEFHKDEIACLKLYNKIFNSYYITPQWYVSAHSMIGHEDDFERRIVREMTLAFVEREKVWKKVLEDQKFGMFKPSKQEDIQKIWNHYINCLFPKNYDPNDIEEIKVEDIAHDLIGFIMG